MLKVLVILSCLYANRMRQMCVGRKIAEYRTEYNQHTTVAPESLIWGVWTLVHRLQKDTSGNVLDTALSLSFSCKFPLRSHRDLTAKEILKWMQPITMNASDDPESEIAHFIFIWWMFKCSDHWQRWICSVIWGQILGSQQLTTCGFIMYWTLRAFRERTRIVGQSRQGIIRNSCRSGGEPRIGSVEEEESQLCNMEMVYRIIARMVPCRQSFLTTWRSDKALEPNLFVSHFSLNG